MKSANICLGQALTHMLIHHMMVCLPLYYLTSKLL